MSDRPPTSRSSDRLRRTTAPVVIADPGLSLSARRVVENSLALVRGERVLIVVDTAGMLFGESLGEAARELGADPQVLRLEDMGQRPHRALNPRIRDAMACAQACVLHIGFEPNELAMRTEFTDLAALLKLRHAHMIGVTRSSLIAGLATDPRRIADVSRALRLRIRSHSVLTARSGSGTELRVGFEPWCRWYETSGVIRAAARVNLPAGELVTSPASVEGTYVADGAVGDSGGVTNTRLTHTAVRLVIEQGRVRRIESQDRTLASRLTVMMHECRDLDRVGQVSLGTNVGLSDPSDDIFTSQKLPSFHLSLGMTFPDRTGASWDCPNWIAFTASGSDVDIDGVPVMRAGRYLID